MVFFKKKNLLFSFHILQIEDLATLRYDRYCEVNRTFSWKADSNEVIVKFSKTSSTIRIVLDFNSIRYPKTSGEMKFVCFL